VGVVELGELKDPPEEGYFEKNWGKYYNTLILAVQNHQKLINNQKKMIEEYAPVTELNRILPGDSKTGIITSGMSFNYTLEALDILGIYDVPILKLGLVYPLSPKQIADFASNLDQIVIMEELDPFLEGEIKKIAYDQGLEIPIRGKDLFPQTGELNTDIAVQVYAKVFRQDTTHKHGRTGHESARISADSAPENAVHVPRLPTQSHVLRHQKSGRGQRL